MEKLLLGLILLGLFSTIRAVITIENADENQFESAAKTFVVETGASPGKLAVLNDIPPAYATVIFLDAAVGADGKIGYWQIFTNTPGRICLGVYNKKKDKKGVLLVESAGRNCMNNSDIIGFQEIEIPPVQRLSVFPDSVIAIEYDVNKFSPTESVVTVESNMKPSSQSGLTLGSVMVQKDSDIRPGEFFYVKPYFVKVDNVMKEYKAFPSFKAIVVGMSNVLELRNGDNSRSGVAMIFMNNVWGTMCDRWYHEKGWPFLFCAEKDYPDTDQIFYTDTPARFQVPAGTPIHLMNPRCKFSQNVTMFSCATHDNITCNHTLDLFIRCKSKVELRKGSTASEGICYVYESNYWGSVCDSRELKLTSSHWSHVCCKERGFSQGALKIEYASDVIINDSQSIGKADPISMHSPICTGSHVDDIKMCKDGPLEYRCDHTKDVFVTCATGSNAL